MPDPAAETKVFPRPSSTSLSAAKPRNEQRQSVQHRTDYYGPFMNGPFAQPATTAENQHLKCEGCGRKGHTPDTCRSQEHPNWNAEHSRINFADTTTGQAVQREARGTHLTCLPPSGVVWDPISKQWEECQALLDWRHKIERARAKLAGRPIPPSTTGPSNRSTRQPSGNPQRSHAEGKPLHLGVIRGGPELYPLVLGTF